MGFDRVTQLLIRQDFVVVLPTDFLSADEPLVFEVLHNPLDRPFGDADFQRDFPEYQIGIAVQRDQHVRVIGEERPPTRRGFALPG